jgi:hypothetical protein
MAKLFHQLLAESLERVGAVAQNNIVRSEQISRMDRERLNRVGCLQKIIRGWYVFCKPHTSAGESTVWYANYWHFVKAYLRFRFGDAYCLSPEASLSLHLGKNYISSQMIVMTKVGGSSVLVLLYETSLFIYQNTDHFPQEITQCDGVNVLPFEYALCKMPLDFYKNSPDEAEIALSSIERPDKLLHYLLQHGYTQAAGRIAGGFRHLQRESLANAILQAMSAAGFKVTEVNPFVRPKLGLQTSRVRSPYSARIEVLWQKTRKHIIQYFSEPRLSDDKRKTVFDAIDAAYVQDAYHSLSIEGYHVSEALIRKISSGQWRPEQSEQDRQHRDAMAAKGYYDAFLMVKETVKRMLQEPKDNISLLKKDLPSWYLALFSPSVTSGIMTTQQLSGFRQHAVYIRHARHVPPPHNALSDCMETLFLCMENEPHPAVQAVLGHWLFGFIHPFPDGNGRIARFVMNALLVSQGYPWTVVQFSHRGEYLDVLDMASVNGDIDGFARLLQREMWGR